MAQRSWLLAKTSTLASPSLSWFRRTLSRASSRHKEVCTTSSVNPALRNVAVRPVPVSPLPAALSHSIYCDSMVHSFVINFHAFTASQRFHWHLLNVKTGLLKIIQLHANRPTMKKLEGCCRLHPYCPGYAFDPFFTLLDVLLCDERNIPRRCWPNTWNQTWDARALSHTLLSLQPSPPPPTPARLLADSCLIICCVASGISSGSLLIKLSVRLHAQRSPSTA